MTGWQRTIATLGGATLLLTAGLWVGRGQPETPPGPQKTETPSPSVAPPSLPRPEPAPAPPAAPPTGIHGPGAGLRSDRPRPARPADRFPTPSDAAPQLVPPAESPEVWQARHQEAASAWWLQTEQALARFGADRGLSEAELASARATLLAMHDALARIRAAVASGSLPPREGRQQMAAARSDAADTLTDLLGSDDAEALRRSLAAEVFGGGF